MEENKEIKKEVVHVAKDKREKVFTDEERKLAPKKRTRRAGEEGDADAAALEAALEAGMLEQVIAIKRVTKVTKGGKKLSFSALTVVGDRAGKVGYSLEKAKEVSIAIKKSMNKAKLSLISIPMKGTTIPHEIIGRCGGARVLLKPASEGTGVIASGPVRAVCEGAGIHNILTKCHRSNNPINVIKATLDGLTRLKTTANFNQSQSQV